jgi:hypothetical protein
MGIHFTPSDHTLNRNSTNEFFRNSQMPRSILADSLLTASGSYLSEATGIVPDGHCAEDTYGAGDGRTATNAA